MTVPWGRTLVIWCGLDRQEQSHYAFIMKPSEWVKDPVFTEILESGRSGVLAESIAPGRKNRQESIERLLWLQVVEVDRRERAEAPRGPDARWSKEERRKDEGLSRLSYTGARLRCSAIGRMVASLEGVSPGRQHPVSANSLRDALAALVESRRHLSGLIDKRVPVPQNAAEWNLTCAEYWTSYVEKLSADLSAFVETHSSALNREVVSTLVRLHRGLEILDDFNFKAPTARQLRALDWIVRLVREWAFRIVVPEGKSGPAWKLAEAEVWVRKQLRKPGVWTLNNLAAIEGAPSKGLIHRTIAWKAYAGRKKESELRPTGKRVSLDAAETEIARKPQPAPDDDDDDDDDEREIQQLYAESIQEDQQDERRYRAAKRSRS